ncbi:Nn.00g007360.m01.CDS01 [Neocucurbitaria sp. VM-36]
MSIQASSQLADNWIFRNKVKPSPMQTPQAARKSKYSKPSPTDPPPAPKDSEQLPISIVQLPVPAAPPSSRPKVVVNRYEPPANTPPASANDEPPSPGSVLQPAISPTSSSLRRPKNIIKSFAAAAVSVLIAFAWWSLSYPHVYDLTTTHSGLGKSIQGLMNASTILTACCPIPQDGTSAVSTSLSEAMVLLDRDVRNAADTAVDGLGKILQLMPTKEMTAQHGLSCLKAGQIATKIRDVANQCLHVANRHEKALNHTRDASNHLDGAIKHTKLQRERLHASRMTKHRAAIEQAKELIGIRSDTTHDRVLGEYNDQVATIEALVKVRTDTVSSVNIQEAERAAWHGAGSDLQLIGIELQVKADMVKLSKICVDSSDVIEIVRHLDAVVRKIVS